MERITFKAYLRRLLRPLLPMIRYWRLLPTRIWIRKEAKRLRKTEKLGVCYITRNFPSRPATRTELAHGGEVKLIYLSEKFPHRFPGANIIYTVSSVGNDAKIDIIQLAKKNGLKIILNQNGVAYPAWYGHGWQESNKIPRKIYEAADFIIFQSEFCKTSAEKFLGKTQTPHEIIYNPVDTSVFVPAQNKKRSEHPILLLGGNQYRQYRFESAIDIFAEVLTYMPNSKLMITGNLWGDDQQTAMEYAQAYIRKNKVEQNVIFLGKYSQADAPNLFQKADILIHTKFNDPSPTIICEALACGLPVVYSASGGCSEIVGSDAGAGVEIAQSWEQIQLPNPQKFAQAIVKVWEDIENYSVKARQRAVEKYSLDVYIQTHEELFRRFSE